MKTSETIIAVNTDPEAAIFDVAHYGAVADLFDVAEELAKLVGQYAEKARIAVRNVRRDGMDHLKADEKKHEISEDERKRLEHDVQKLTDDTIKEIDEAAAAKEKEILGK